MNYLELPKKLIVKSKEKVTNNIFTTLAITVFVTPILVNFGVSLLPIYSEGDNNTWISFWGSYLGGIFTLVAVMITVKESKKQIEIAKKANDIAIIKNDKEFIYQLHKDANNHLYELVFDGKPFGLDAEINGKNTIAAIYTRLTSFCEQSEHTYSSLEIIEATKILEYSYIMMQEYYIKINVLVSDIEFYHGESLAFFHNIQRTNRDLKLIAIAETIIESKELLSSVPINEPNVDISRITESAKRLINIPKQILDQLESLTND